MTVNRHNVVGGVLVYRCTVHTDRAECQAAMWFPALEPERPLDQHALFCDDGDCPACERAWHLLGLPRHDLPVLL